MNALSKTMTVRDLIVVGIFSALMLAAGFVVWLVVSPFQNALLYGSVGTTALINGAFYILMVSKVPKHGTLFLLFLLEGLYWLIAGYAFLLPLSILGGILCEAVMLGGGYKRPFQVTAAYILHYTVYALLIFTPYLLFPAENAENLRVLGYSPEQIEASIKVYTSPNTIALVLAASAGGAFLGAVTGYKLLAKHFKPAGIAQ